MAFDDPGAPVFVGRHGSLARWLDHASGALLPRPPPSATSAASVAEGSPPSALGLGAVVRGRVTTRDALPCGWPPPSPGSSLDDGLVALRAPPCATISVRRQRFVADSGRASSMRTVSPTWASFFSSCALNFVVRRMTRLVDAMAGQALDRDDDRRCPSCRTRRGRPSSCALPRSGVVEAVMHPLRRPRRPQPARRSDRDCRLGPGPSAAGRCSRRV